MQYGRRRTACPGAWLRAISEQASEAWTAAPHTPTLFSMISKSRRASRKFVSSAKRPDSVTPSHVPRLTRSRPASTSGWSCQKCASAVALLAGLALTGKEACKQCKLMVYAQQGTKVA
jgi:hypothetical protein